MWLTIMCQTQSLAPRCVQKRANVLVPDTPGKNVSDVLLNDSSLKHTNGHGGETDDETLLLSTGVEKTTEAFAMSEEKSLKYAQTLCLVACEALTTPRRDAACLQDP